MLIQLELSEIEDMNSKVGFPRAQENITRIQADVKFLTKIGRVDHFHYLCVENLFKGLLKKAKKKLEEAQKKGDPTEIKDVNGLVVLYDSLQLGTVHLISRKIRLSGNIDSKNRNEP